MKMDTISLKEIPKNKKYQLAYLAGYKVKETSDNGRCSIIGADNCIDNDFSSIDDVLLLIKSELKSKGFSVAA